MCRRRLRTQRIAVRAGGQNTFAVHRAAEGIEHAAEPCFARIDLRGTIVEVGSCSKAHAVERTERHDLRPAIAKSHDFTGDPSAVCNGELYLPPKADGASSSGHFDQEPLDPGHPPEARQGRY